jgi:hypothetical protein
MEESRNRRRLKLRRQSGSGLLLLRSKGRKSS